MAVSSESAQAKGQVAAEGVATPTEDQPVSPSIPSGDGSDAPSAKKVGKRTVETLSVVEDETDSKVRDLAEEEAKRKAEDPTHIEYREASDDVGGGSFDFPPSTENKPDKAAKNVAAVAADDAALKAAEPNAVVYREAGSSGDIGGESFSFKAAPPKD